MYDLVETIIKPLTKARLVSYAELLEPLAPQVFVSHWWGEEFVCFVRALQLFAGTYLSQESHALPDSTDASNALAEANLAFWVFPLLIGNGRLIWEARCTRAPSSERLQPHPARTW